MMCWTYAEGQVKQAPGLQTTKKLAHVCAIKNALFLHRSGHAVVVGVAAHGIKAYRSLDRYACSSACHVSIMMVAIPVAEEITYINNSRYLRAPRCVWLQCSINSLTCRGDTSYTAATAVRETVPHVQHAEHDSSTMTQRC